MREGFGKLGRTARRAAVLALTGLCMAAGCMSESGMYDGLRGSRQDAYARWRAAREGNGAQTRLKGPLSLQDALKVALVNNKTLQSALEGRRVAGGGVTESWSKVLPSVAATAGYSRLDEVQSFDVGGGSVSLGALDNYSAGLEVVQPLFRGGASLAAMRSARWGYLLADEQVRQTVQDVIHEVALAYYDALLAQHLFEVNRDAVASSKAHLADVQIKRQQGVASDFDVLRAQVDVSNFEADMIQQQNRIHRARTRILRAMGVSQDSEVRLTDHLRFSPMKPVFEEAVQLAYENRPDLYQAELNVRSQREALRIAQSQYWPRLDAFFRQNWANPDPHNQMLRDWGDQWSAGIAGVWTLFDGLGREGRVRQESSRLRQRRVELVDTEERTLQEVQQAILSLRDAEELAQSQQMNLQRAKEALRLAEVGYRNGVTEAVAVTESRSALTRALGLYYEAVYYHTIARIELQRAMGVLGPRAGRATERAEPAEPGEIREFDASKTSEAPAAATKPQGALP